MALFLSRLALFKPREARLPSMERFPDFGTLHYDVVTFAGEVIESERPTLPEQSLGHELHPENHRAFQQEQLLIQEIIHYWASRLEEAQRDLVHSQNSQLYCNELEAWSNYADIFNSVYPLILHDPKIALQTLAIKLPLTFWYYFWSWCSDCHDDILEPNDQVIGYLRREMVPELCSEPLQRQACYEAWNEVKPKLMDHEMQSMAITMALQATGLSHDIPPP